MTKEQFNRARELCEKVKVESTAPWVFYKSKCPDTDFWEGYVKDSNNSDIFDVNEDGKAYAFCEDAEFIAESRQLLPIALDTIETQEARIKVLEEAAWHCIAVHEDIACSCNGCQGLRKALKEEVGA